jgi:hypothetical protein
MPASPTKKASEDPQLPDERGDDTEGHSLWIDPGSARQLARNKNDEIERYAREAKRAKEAKKR